MKGIHMKIRVTPTNLLFTISFVLILSFVAILSTSFDVKAFGKASFNYAGTTNNSDNATVINFAGYSWYAIGCEAPGDTGTNCDTKLSLLATKDADFGTPMSRFGDGLGDYGYEKSELHTDYLNLFNSFTAAEKSLILPTTIDVKKSNSTTDGPLVDERLFPLSVLEWGAICGKYIDSQTATQSNCTNANSRDILSHISQNYWLRSANKAGTDSAWYVQGNTGTALQSGWYNSWRVRPVAILDLGSLSKTAFMSGVGKKYNFSSGSYLTAAELFTKSTDKGIANPVNFTIEPKDQAANTNLVGSITASYTLNSNTITVNYKYNPDTTANKQVANRISLGLFNSNGDLEYYIPLVHKTAASLTSSINAPGTETAVLPASRNGLSLKVFAETVKAAADKTFDYMTAPAGLTEITATPSLPPKPTPPTPTPSPIVEPSPAKTGIDLAALELLLLLLLLLVIPAQAGIQSR
jgi:hypothetical protein